MEDKNIAFDKQTVFYFICKTNQKLLSSGVISSQYGLLLNSLVKMSDRLYLNILTEIINLNTKKNIDLNYYLKLFEIKNKNLCQTYIRPCDPFLPLFEFIQLFLKLTNQLKELRSPNQIESFPNIQKMSIKILLLNFIICLEDLRKANCNGYNLLKGTNKGIKVNPKFRVRINSIIEEIFDSYKIYLFNRLDETIKQSCTYNCLSYCFENMRLDFSSCEQQIKSEQYDTDTEDLIDEYETLSPSNSVKEFRFHSHVYNSLDWETNNPFCLPFIDDSDLPINYSFVQNYSSLFLYLSVLIAFIALICCFLLKNV